MKKIPSMKRAGTALGLTLVALFSLGSLLRAVPPQDKTLPDFVVRELTHLEETYRVLDVTAAKVCPGWNDFREFAFMLKYPNNLQVLIGHPNPPEPFEKVPCLKVEDKEVYADFSAVSTAKVEYPMMAGGGPLPFGRVKDGKPMTTVKMNFMSTDILKKGGHGIIPLSFCVELQINGYIHELFHCFQNNHIKQDRVGNLMFNPDAPYVLYSTLAGKALHRAFLAKTREESIVFIKDFLAARMLKRKAGMPEQQQKQESGDDLMEGIAVYSEVRTCEILKEAGYKNVDELLEAHTKQLLRASEEIYDCKGKCYDYGCARPLSSRNTSRAGRTFLPRIPPPSTRYYRKESRSTRRISRPMKRDSANSTPTTKSKPGAMKPSENVTPLTTNSAGAVERPTSSMSRRSTAYGSHLAPDAPQYKLGLINMYMSGLPAIKIDQTEISPISVPVEGNELNY